MKSKLFVIILAALAVAGCGERAASVSTYETSNGLLHVGKKNADGRLIEVEYRDSKGKLTYNPEEGYAMMKLKYLGGWFPLKETYYDAHRRKFVNPVWGCAEHRYVYQTIDNVFHLTGEEFYDADGELINSKQGYARIEYTDEGGGLPTKTYFDKDGRMVNDTYGVARESYVGTDSTSIVAHYDKDGHLVVHPFCGYAKLAERLDEHHNTVSAEYFDAEEHLTRGDEGYAQAIYKYSNYRRVLEAYYDENHLLVTNTRKGYAMHVVEQDSAQREISSSFYGADERLIYSESHGYAQRVYEYDSDGHQVKESFFDADGNLMVNPHERYAVEERVYENGCHSHNVKYDASGKKIE